MQYIFNMNNVEKHSYKYTYHSRTALTPRWSTCCFMMCKGDIYALLWAYVDNEVWALQDKG